MYGHGHYIKKTLTILAENAAKTLVLYEPFCLWFLSKQNLFCFQWIKWWEQEFIVRHEETSEGQAVDMR